MQSNYEEEGDVLHIALGEARPSIGWEPQEGIVIHRAVLTGDFVGVTVVNHRGHFKGHPERVADAVREALPQEALDLITA